MLKKLMKYDLKWGLKVILIYLSLSLLCAILGRLTNFLPNTIIFNIIGGILKGASISLSVTGLVNGIIKSWVRVIQNMYKDESYLTHTLPIKTETIYLSKILSSVITIVISTVVVFLSIIISYITKDNAKALIDSLKLITSSMGVNTTLVIILLCLLLLVEVVFVLFCGFYGVIYGYSFNNKKGAKTFLFGLISYGVASNISLVVMLFSSIFSKELYDMIFNAKAEINYNTFIYMIVGCIVLYLIYIYLLYYLSNNKLKKGVNID